MPSPCWKASSPPCIQGIDFYRGVNWASPLMPIARDSELRFQFGMSGASKPSTVSMPMMQIRIMRVLVANGLVPMPV